MDTARRYIEVLAFVALWMALGWILHLDVNSYLLIGLPLVVPFQRFVRQRPLRQLWVRDAAAFRLGLVGIVIAVLLMLAPGYDLIFVAVPKKLWLVALWLLCAMAGCICCLCNYSAACKRRSPWLAQLHISCAHRYGNYGSQRPSKPPRYRCSAFKTVFVAQAVLTLLCGHFRARGGCVSRRSRFAHLSAGN
jgi:hypothetical protein